MANNAGVTFNGKRIIHPSAHTRIDASALSGYGSSGGKIIALIGNSLGGEPNKLLSFTSSIEAQNVLKGGDLLKGGALCWNPSGDGVGADEIIMIRAVDNCLQAKATVGGIELHSVDFGEHTNKIGVKVTEDEDGAYELMVTYFPENIVETYKHIGDILDVACVEGEATIEIADNVLVVVKDEKEYMFDLVEEYGNINSLVTGLRNIGLKASLKKVGNKNIEAKGLDDLGLTVLDTKGIVLKAIEEDFKYQTRYSNLIVIDKVGEVTPTETSVKLSGGSNGFITKDSVSKALDLLVGEGVQIIVPLTSKEQIEDNKDTTITREAIQEMCNDFVAEQSESERSLMLGIYGLQREATVEDAIGCAVNFNSSRAVVVYPAINKAILGDEVEELDGCFSACLVAGRLAGKEIGDPITMDNIAISGVSNKLTNTQINTLIQSGVTAIEFVRHSTSKGYRFAQGLTTHQTDNNPNFREISMRMVSDELSSGLVEKLENNFVGGKGTLSTLALIKNATQSFLDEKVREGTIVEYDPSSVTVELIRDAVYINYTCTPTGAINYILITTTYTATKLSV